MINCPYCGKLTDPRLDACVHCGGVLRKTAQPAEGKAAASQTCPNCKALVQEGDIICVVCGRNLLTGQQVAAQQLSTEVPTPSRILFVSIMALVGIVLLVALVVGGYFLLQDPISRAQKLSLEGRTPEAVAILEQFVAKRPEHARGQYELGKLYWRAEQYSRAAQSFEKAARAGAGGDTLRYAVASLAAQNLPTTRPQERATLERLAGENPDDATVWYLVALARGVDGDSEGELEALKKVIAIDPQRGEARALLAVAYARKNDIEAAARELEAVVRDYPDAADAKALLGLLDLSRGKTAEASANLTAALQSGTALKTSAQLQLGLLLLSDGKYDVARQALDEARNAPDADPAAAYFHAVAAQAQGATNDAVREFESIVQGNGPYAREAALRIVEAELTNGEVERARSAMDKATGLGAQGALVETLRGRIFAVTGDVGAAQSAFKQAIILDETYPPPHLENGLIYIKRELFAEGIQELKRYLTLLNAPPDDPHAQSVSYLAEELERATSEQAPPPAEAPAVAQAPTPAASPAETALPPMPADEPAAKEQP